MPVLAAPRRALSELTGWEERIVVLVALGAIVLGATSPGEPTGLTVWDAALRAMFAVFVVLASSRARRWSWLPLSGIAAALGDGSLWTLLAVGALTAAVVAAFAARRDPRVGAGIGFVAAGALLRLTTEVPSLLPSLAGLAATTPVLVSAYRMSTPAQQRRLRGSLWIAGTMAAVLLVVGGLAAVEARNRATVAVAEVGDGLRSLRAGEDEVAFDQLDRAAASFDDAGDAAGAMWARPSRLLPVLGQHLAVLERLTRDGEGLSRVGANSALDLSLSDVIIDGNVDLNRIAAIRPVARSMQTKLERVAHQPTEFDSPWLIPELQTKIRLYRSDLAAAHRTARVISEALDIAPQMLGRDEPKRYLILFVNPAESRELGGILGDYGYLTADRGRLEFTGAVDSTDLTAALRRRALEPLEGLPPPTAAARPHRFGPNWTSSPDIATVTRIALELTESLGLPKADGVLTVDPYTLVALLKFSGPVRVEGFERSIRANNALPFILRDQYVLYDGPASARKEAVGAIADEVFDSLFDGGKLPDPRTLADALAAQITSRRLHFTAPALTSLLDDAGFDTGLRSALDDNVDSFLLTQGNTRPNKLDAYLHRTVTYDVRTDPATSRLDATVEVILENSAPAGLPEYVTAGEKRGVAVGVNRINLDLYSSHELAGVTANGEPLATGSMPLFGLTRHSVRVEVPRGRTVTVLFRLEGVWTDRDYRIRVIPAATAFPDDVVIDLDHRGVRRRLHADATRNLELRIRDR